MAMKWIKAAIVGALGALIMFVLMMLGINNGFAPFNVPPSAAFLTRLGLNIGPLALIGHFVYGMFWSIVLVVAFGRSTNWLKGIGLALALWLFMMLVYSPIIGWGVFGFGGPGHQLAPDNPLFLGAPIKYVVATLVLHLIYGGTIGWLNPVWINFEEAGSGESRSTSGAKHLHA